VKKRVAAAVVGVALVGALTTGCEDDGAVCVHSHLETQLIPVMTGKTTTLVPHMVSVCDRWEYPKENA